MRHLLCCVVLALVGCGSTTPTNSSQEPDGSIQGHADASSHVHVDGSVDAQSDGASQTQADGSAQVDSEGGVSRGDSAATSGDAGASCSRRTPVNHRATGSTCPAMRGSGGGPFFDGAIPMGDQCNTDLDCTAGKNGRCLLSTVVGGPPRGPIAECSYDACSSDSDCAGDVVCVCRSSDSDSDPNFCGTGNCRIDSDCGPCGFCSPSDNGGYCGFSTSGPSSAYYCHTSQDTCIDNTDCGVDASDPACNFNVESSRWSCGTDCQPPPP
jgi:hypothetical protein